MIETTVQNPEHLETLRADSQGRVNLGVKFANREITLVVASTEELPAEAVGIQHTIDAGPMMAHQRQGILFARAFGIGREYLRDDHDAAVQDGEVDPETVSAADINWELGRIIDPKNVAQFVFEESTDDHQFSTRLTAQPASVTRDEDTYESPSYRFENEHGDGSAIASAFVEKVQDVYAYDPTEDLEYVRVAPDEAPMPVFFGAPEADTYIVIAPRVPESAA